MNDNVLIELVDKRHIIMRHSGGCPNRTGVQNFHFRKAIEAEAKLISLREHFKTAYGYTEKQLAPRVFEFQSASALNI